MTLEQTTGAFYPRSIKAPSEPLSLPQFIYRFIKNPLLALPQQAYEEPVVSQESSQQSIFWITGPDLIEEILLRHGNRLLRSPVQIRIFRRSLKDGILSADGELWRWQRRTMAPLFRPAEILDYVPVMAAVAEEQVESWRHSQPGTLQDIDQDMVDVTFKIIMRTMLNGSAPGEGEIIRKTTAIALKHVTWEMLYGSFRLPNWFPHPASWTLERAAKRLRGAVRDIIERRKQSGDNDATDLLTHLLAARDPETGEPMSMERLINNLLTLIEAGHETTSRALGWTLYLISRAPEWQNAMREEIRSICGTGPIEGHHIDQLQITQQVLKETMRLYPPVPVISRVTAEPLNLIDLYLPQGSIILFPIYCIHRHRLLWDDPDRFDPERFTPEREATYPRTQYMPFGAGSRICLGNNFAMAEATAVLAAFIRSATFEWDGKIDPEPVSRITLHPGGGIALKVNLLN